MKGGIQLSSFKPWRFTICTFFPGHLGNQSFQKLAPARGQEKGENLSRPKKNQKSKTNSNLGGKTIYHFGLVGVSFGLLASLMSFTSAPHAQAASAWNNIDSAKRAIANVAPVVSEENVDGNTASLVFASDEYIQKPLVAETQITKPEPVKKAVQAVKAKTVTASTAVARTASAVSSDLSGHSFPYGYCTYYVSTLRAIPWSGNAGTWLNGARAAGFATGSTPQTGAIVVTSEGGYTGHVAIVNSVNEDGTINITEMNYRGWGVVSSRTISGSASFIKGYIY